MGEEPSLIWSNPTLESPPLDEVNAEVMRGSPPEGTNQNGRLHKACHLDRLLLMISHHMTAEVPETQPNAEFAGTTNRLENRKKDED